ncbi:MAG: hypothetical protein Q7R41_01740, partial [Phycisphaerales bacterium]|nr:hypothetical protein [Phycisphaerales bacterium]
AENTKVPSQTIEQASGIIRSGPRADLSDREKAAMILEAGNVLKKTLSALTGKGGEELKETQRLVELQRQKPLVPGILRVIHESAPTPSGSLAQAQTPEEVEKALPTAPPRGERDQVFIESLNMTFEPELGKFKGWEKSLIDMPPPINAYDVNQPLPGMKIVITCRTPNTSGAEFIRDKFMMPLRQNGRKRGQGFYIDNVVLTDGNKVTAASTAPTTVPTGRGTTRGGPTGPTVSSGAALDPVTLEPTVNDWRFEIWASAILSELPESGDGETGKAAGKNDEGKGGNP